MNVKEYEDYMARRREIISLNRSNMIKGLPLSSVPPRIAPPKVRVAYSRKDDSYMGRMSDDDECPEDCYVKMENAV